MNDTFLAGHVRVGFTSARGSMFGLTVSRDRLTLEGLGRHEFSPEQVVAFAPDGPAWMSRGYRIVHNRPDVPGRVYFSCSGGRDAIDAALETAGFVARGAPFTGWRKPGPWRMVFIAMAIASALLLLRNHGA